MTGRQQETVEKIMQAVHEYGSANYNERYELPGCEELTATRLEELQDLIINAICASGQKEPEGD